MAQRNPVGAGEAAELLARIAGGEEPALRRLIGAYGPPVTGFARRFLGSAVDGEEVAQEVFVTVWRKAGSFDPARGSAEGWLWRIARNACIDRVRRRRLRWLVGLDESPVPVEELADPAAPEDGHAARAGLAAVRVEIAALPRRQRMALLMSAVGGVEMGEIAEAMGLSRGAAEQLVVRARRTLRARLPDVAGLWEG